MYTYKYPYQLQNNLKNTDTTGYSDDHAEQDNWWLHVFNSDSFSKIQSAAWSSVTKTETTMEEHW